ncbi:MAG TPA: hypothetical protein VF832_14445 [Longimicrobiales bacterium]
MHRPIVLAVAALAGLSLVAAPVAGQKKGVPPAHGAPAKAAPASPTAPSPTFDLDALAAAAKLDAGARARVAPHVAAMSAEMKQLHDLTGKTTRTTPAAQRDSIHKQLNVHYAAFEKHRAEAVALVPPAQRPAFEEAVKQQMGVRPRAAVGNPHAQLPSAHPKLNPQGGPATPPKK